MKTKRSLKHQSLALVTGLAVFAVLWAMPGIVHGQVQGGDLFSTVNLGGTFNNGASPLYQYTPQYLPPTGTPSIFASGLDTPRGLAFDSSGNLFVVINSTTDGTDCLGENTVTLGSILKINSSGVMSTFATGFPSGWFLQGLATDRYGNVFVTIQQPYNPCDPPFTGQELPTPIYEVTHDGMVKPIGMLPGAGWGLAFDKDGNLYVATVDGTGGGNSLGGEILEFTPNPDGTWPPSTSPSPFIPPTTYPYPDPGLGPNGLAFDSSSPQNLFVSTQDINANGDIRKFDLNGTEITYNGNHFATALHGPRGLAFDSGGNLFLAEIGIPGTATTGDILEFMTGGTQTVFASQNFGSRGNRGPEWLAFTTGAVTPPTTAVTLTLPDATTPLTATVTSIDQNSVTPPTSNFVELSGTNLAFDISTTTTPTPPIIIAFTVSPLLDVSQLKALHYECGTQNPPVCNWVDRTIRYECDTQSPPNCGWVDSTQTFHPAGQGGYPSNPAPNTVYGSVNSLSPFLIAKFKFKAQIQQPINADGSSVFSAKRGVVPVTFTLTSDGVATCQLPAATISVFRTAGGVTGSIDESAYLSKADSESNFRISNCQYVYNLAASSLGTGTYLVNISIGGSVAGSATFALK